MYITYIKSLFVFLTFLIYAYINAFHNPEQFNICFLPCYFYYFMVLMKKLFFKFGFFKFFLIYKNQKIIYLVLLKKHIILIKKSGSLKNNFKEPDYMHSDRRNYFFIFMNVRELPLFFIIFFISRKSRITVAVLSLGWHPKFFSFAKS